MQIRQRNQYQHITDCINDQYYLNPFVNQNRSFVNIFSAFIKGIFIIITQKIYLYCLLTGICLKMRKEEKNQLKLRIVELARLSSTGTPAELGASQNLSARTIKRLVREIRLSGINIRFNRNLSSYIIDN